MVLVRQSAQHGRKGIIVTREETAAEIAAKHERLSESVRRTIMSGVSVLAAREWLKVGILTLPGVSADPDTIADIMDFVDHFVQRKEQLDTEAGHFDRRL